jgi:hypothetical protein
MKKQKKLWHNLSIKLGSQKSFSFLFTLGITVLVFCLIYLLAIPLIKLAETKGSNYIVEVFINRGAIPYFIVVFFGFSIGLLLKHILVLGFENYAFEIIRNEIKECSDLPTKCIYSDSLSFLKIINSDKLEVFKNTLIYKRLSQGMQHLFNTQDTNAMNEYFKHKSDIEYSEMESGFSIVKYINWLIPTLGFIGTVLGLGIGIAGFAQVIMNADNFSQIKQYLPSVTYNLGVAFDTTFLALIMSVFLMYLTSHVSSLYENLIESLDVFCLDEISSRFKLHSTVAEQLKEVLREIKNDIANILQANRIEVIKSLEKSIWHISSGLEQINTSVREDTSKGDISPLIVLMQNIFKQLKGIDKSEAIDKILDELALIREQLDPIKQKKEKKEKKEKMEKMEKKDNKDNKDNIDKTDLSDVH